ncbi:hypothetical protein E4G67_01195 [Candidatus Bathyarchaeota archaeon]|nr:MAG: hypothetical protein E4G67_01195 [Candidatus Bathyarchaeota archaeon]
MKKPIYDTNAINTLNKIYVQVCKLGQNFDTLIDIACEANKQTKFRRGGFANYSKLQTTESMLRVAQKEKQRHCKN